MIYNKSKPNIKIMKSTKETRGRKATVTTKPVARFDRMSIKRKQENPNAWVVYSTDKKAPIYIFPEDETSDNVRCSYRRIANVDITKTRPIRMKNFIDLGQ